LQLTDFQSQSYKTARMLPDRMHTTYIKYAQAKCTQCPKSTPKPKYIPYPESSFSLHKMNLQPGVYISVQKPYPTPLKGEIFPLPVDPDPGAGAFLALRTAGIRDKFFPDPRSNPYTRA
jgi:hypothetical protein